MIAGSKNYLKSLCAKQECLLGLGTCRIFPDSHELLALVVVGAILPTHTVCVAAFLERDVVQTPAHRQNPIQPAAPGTGDVGAGLVCNVNLHVKLCM